MTIKIEPKHCPFCGHTGVRFADGSSYRRGVVVCAGCEAQTGEVPRNYPHDDEWHKHGLEEWNRRATDAELVDALHRARGWQTKGVVNYSDVEFVDAVLAKYKEKK